MAIRAKGRRGLALVAVGERQDPQAAAVAVHGRDVAEVVCDDVRRIELEHYPVALRRPVRQERVAGEVRDLPQARSVGSDREDLAAACHFAAKRDQAVRPR